MTGLRLQLDVVNCELVPSSSLRNPAVVTCLVEEVVHFSRRLERKSLHELLEEDALSVSNCTIELLIRCTLP